MRLVDYLNSVFFPQSDKAKRTKELVRQIEESLDVVQLRKDVMEMRKELDEVKEENALMRKELEKHNIIVPSSVKEPKEDEQPVEVAGLEEEQTGDKKMEEEIKMSLLDSESG